MQLTPGAQAAAAGAITLLLCTHALAVVLEDSHHNDCGNPFVNAYGPYDYRTAPPSRKSIVESHHFTPDVEALRHGATARLGGDLDYTLRAFPNHPRALLSMIRLGERDNKARPAGAEFTIECYLQRAVAFRPDDMTARRLRGIYYAMQGRYKAAIDDLSIVVKHEPDNANAHYNLGLSYFRTKNYELAVKEAKAAQSLGFTLPGLKNMLKAAGKWSD
jgi:tetratricopeptide (TPR) repeat protein